MIVVITCEAEGDGYDHSVAINEKNDMLFCGFEGEFNSQKSISKGRDDLLFSGPSHLKVPHKVASHKSDRKLDQYIESTDNSPPKALYGVNKSNLKRYSQSFNDGYVNGNQSPKEPRYIHPADQRLAESSQANRAVAVFK